MAISRNIQIPHTFWKVNDDYAGFRSLNQEQEIVQFKNNSTIRVWYNTETNDYPPHWHSALEIIVPVENYYDVEINEEQFHISPGEVLAIPPGEMHTLRAPSQGSRIIFMFDISPYSKLKGFSGIQSLLINALHITKEGYPQIYDEVFQLLQDISTEYFSEHEYKELTIHSLLLKLFVRLGHNHIDTGNLFPNVRPGKQKTYVKKFNDLLDYIDTHYMEELTLEEVAASIGFSKYHFSRLFRQYTNFTFCDYVNYRRIKVAEELLILPDLSITEVALQSGFPSISTFNRLFKQQKNCTPSEYRAMNQHIETPR